MLELHGDQPGAETLREQGSRTRTIETADKEKDELVYELHGLTDEEVGTEERVGTVVRQYRA